MKTRKILTCILAGIMSLSALTGCAGGTQTDGTNSTTANTTSAQKNENADTSAANTEAKEEPITLDMYFPVSVWHRYFSPKMRRKTFCKHRKMR